MTGIRRVEAPTRANAPLISFDKAFGLVKINPIAAWSRRRDAGLHRRQRHPGQSRSSYEGYPSIGCAPCTAKPAEGADPRSGRWAGLSRRRNAGCTLRDSASLPPDPDRARQLPTHGRRATRSAASAHDWRRDPTLRRDARRAGRVLRAERPRICATCLPTAGRMPWWCRCCWPTPTTPASTSPR